MPSPEQPDNPLLVPAPAWRAADEAPQPPDPSRNGFARALIWAGLGFLLTASLLLFPIGLLALPFVLAACWSLAARGPYGVEVLALGVGAAAFTGLVAINNTNPCGPSPEVIELAPGQSSSCGGADGGAFAVFTVAVLLLVTLAYVVARTRRRRTS